MRAACIALVASMCAMTAGCDNKGGPSQNDLTQTMRALDEGMREATVHDVSCSRIDDDNFRCELTYDKFVVGDLLAGYPSGMHSTKISAIFRKRGDRWRIWEDYKGLSRWKV